MAKMSEYRTASQVRARISFPGDPSAADGLDLQFPLKKMTKTVPFGFSTTTTLNQ